MQWNKENKYTQPQEDVYSAVKTSFNGGSNVEPDNQEFSLDTIQKKLGAFYGAEDQDFVTTSSSPDLMPSDQTIKMSYQREYAMGKGTSLSKLSTKQKVGIASFAVVVLALVVAIALCSVYVSGAFTSAVALEQGYADLSAQVADLTAQVSQEDYDALMKRAAELGYTDSSFANTKKYTEVETRPAQNFEVESNWFDSLCDWLCNAFGG